MNYKILMYIGAAIILFIAPFGMIRGEIAGGEHVWIPAILAVAVFGAPMLLFEAVLMIGFVRVGKMPSWCIGMIWCSAWLIFPVTGTIYSGLAYAACSGPPVKSVIYAWIVPGIVGSAIVVLSTVRLISGLWGLWRAVNPRRE